MDGLPRIIIVTGAMAAGKSTIAQALAERLPRSVHLQGDLFGRMIVGGAVEMTPSPSAEALAQLELRYRLAADAAAGYAAAGYRVIYQDAILGPYLGQVAERLRPWRPGVVVLDPEPAVLARRDRCRQASAYGCWQPEQMSEILRRQTPRIGRWIDSSSQTVEETLAAILADPAGLRAG